MDGKHTAEALWGREDSVACTVEFEETRLQGGSQRAFARERGVPRTTLQYWLACKAGMDGSPAVVAFFESPEGLALLHRLVIAVQFVMTVVVGAGLRPVAEVLRLAGLEPFVANSVSVRHRLSREMERQIRAYSRDQRPLLAHAMPAKRITVCEDETFHPEICLVAIEPVSNFILLEEYADQRDAKTWDATLDHALKDLQVRVIQSTSDEGKGLLGHVEHGLGAHHSPDVFHVQQDLSQATSIALAGQVTQAEKATAEAAARTAARRLAAQAWVHAEGHGPGRPPNFEASIAEAQVAEEMAQGVLGVARERQERAHRAVRGIGQAYHPVDLKTGAMRTVAQVATDLERHIAEIKAVAKEAHLPERCLKKIQKAHRVVPSMVNTMTFFHREVKAQMDGCSLSDDEGRVLEKCLLPAAYLGRVAGKASSADTRLELRDLASRLRADAQGMLSTITADRRATVLRLAQDCADIFQRSSSCVEGRNGQLALRHHSLHSISATRLAALTTVHNYFIRRPDGTTAAERFFGAKPNDLFRWLLDHIDMPARPAQKRRLSHAQLN